ncbi:hypothetical protein [Clostridium saccharoperbutylacetonicum]
MEIKKDSILDLQDIVAMLDGIGSSIAVIDKNFSFIYLNKRGQWFYEHAFGVKDLLGKSIECCNKPKHIENIKRLIKEFEDSKKTLNFFKVPENKIEGGFVKVLHLPYYRDNEFTGIIEFNLESSLEPGGYGEQVIDQK